MTHFDRAMGWLPDYPDFRDYTERTPRIHEIMRPRRLRRRPKGEAFAAVKAEALPASVDLREWCSPVEDQRNLGSCTAHAGVGVIEYYERKCFGRHIDASRLFLYKVTRNLMKAKGDNGWLPYEYLLAGLAEDFWSVLKKEWVDTGAFGE